VLAAWVIVRVESVAVNVQAPVEVIVTALNVATPAAATALKVPPMVQPVEAVSTTVSVEPVPEPSTYPRASSTETLNAVKAVDTGVAAGG
jgi:hypothetical protein